MKTTKSTLALAAALAASLALPSAAAAEFLVPPDNSAVNQYTESLPTPRGSRDSEQSEGKRRPSPSEALGKRNARRLERQGEDGRAVAAFAAATEPSADGTEPAEDEGGSGAGAGRGDGESGSAGGAPASGGSNGDTATAKRTEVAEPNGSSAIAEVVGEATGTSSGRLGLLLPLLIVATSIWAGAYALRHRQRTG